MLIMSYVSSELPERLLNSIKPLSLHLSLIFLHFIASEKGLKSAKLIKNLSNFEIKFKKIAPIDFFFVFSILICQHVILQGNPKVLDSAK